MKDVTWGKLYPEKKGRGSCDGVEYIWEGPARGATRREGGRGLKEEDKKPQGRDWAARVLLQSYSGHGQLVPCPRAARTGVDKEPSTTLKSTGKMRQGNGPQKVAGQHPSDL